MKVLLVEDDALIGHGISQAMLNAKHNLDWITNGEDALQALNHTDYDAMLLDLGLPDMDGLKVLQQLRQKHHTLPVVIITARDTVTERINGLDLGADDYLVKPFSVAELQARLRAVSRRNQGSGNPTIETELLKLNPNDAKVEINGRVEQLTAREYVLLEALMLRPGQTFSREQLESKIYAIDEEISSNAIEVIIHGLRKKLGKTAIKNIRGLGWMVRP